MAKAYTDITKTTEIKIGDVIVARGQEMEVVKVLPFGTLKVASVKRYARGARIMFVVSGLAF